MSEFDQYTEQEYSLYEVVNWAMLGLIDTVNETRPDVFWGFLDDLYLDDRGADISGEPGWTLERIDLKEGFENKYSFISIEMQNELFSLLQNGEVEAFWLESPQSQCNTCLLSAASFWKVVSDSFEEFAINNPGNEEVLKSAILKYPQLVIGKSRCYGTAGERDLS